MTLRALRASLVSRSSILSKSAVKGKTLRELNECFLVQLRGKIGDWPGQRIKMKKPVIGADKVSGLSVSRDAKKDDGVGNK